MKRSLFLIVSLAIMVFSARSSLWSQEILTADQFLATVGERYASIADYSAKIAITTSKTKMFGTIIYKNAGLLRIDFTSPEEQVITYNGDTLTVYIPEYRAVLNQTTGASKKASGANIASAEGLKLLRRNYAAAYAVGPDPQPLDAGSSELVVTLVLTRRSLSEGFRELHLAIDPQTDLIRRIEGKTIADETIQFDFTDITLNQNIPEARFAYDSPASANLYNNFLFKN